MGHNPPALARLFERISRTFPSSTKLRVVLGLSFDKDVRACLSTVLTHIPPDRLHFVQAPHPRAATVSQLQDMARVEVGRCVPEENCQGDSVREGVARALRKAEEGGEVVLVCGTFFIMGEARQALGLDEPQDSQVIAEVAGSHFRASQEHFLDSKAPAAAAP